METPQNRRFTNWLETPDEQNEVRAAMWAVANNVDKLLRLMTARKTGLMDRVTEVLGPHMGDPKVEKLYKELLSILN